MDGGAYIEIACSWLTSKEPPDVTGPPLGVANGMSDGLAKPGLSLNQSAVRKLTNVHREWLAIDLRAQDASGTRLPQTIAVTTTDRCLISATVTGTPEAHAMQATAFLAALADLHVEHSP